MIELEMSDSKAARPRRRKAAKGNPTTISTRVRTLNGERLKVNDKMGNPHRDRNRRGVARRRYRQGALRRRRLPELCRHAGRDGAAPRGERVRLRPPGGRVRCRRRHRCAPMWKRSRSPAPRARDALAPAGVEVDDARLTHLAYSPEIAQAMLRRQQAEAVIAARKKIVEGGLPWSTWP